MSKPPTPRLNDLDGDKYALGEDYSVKFGYWLRDLQFMIPEGFESDLASIPWFLRWFIDRASLGIFPPIFHDYLCDKRGKIINLQGEEIQLTPFQVNLFFLLAMQAVGISTSRSLIAFMGVLIGSPKW
jgi:hypothetical protein